MNSNEILALIPARGGSKRLPGKNTKPLNNRPLIYWTIEAAIKSKYVDKIFVSTDSQQIAETAQKYGAEVPFFRPPELASDTATSFDVIKHAIENIKNNSFKYILLLQPTSPLRTAEDIDNTIELFIEKKAKSVVSVCEMEHSPLWSNTLPDDFSMKNFLRPEIQNKRSQDLPVYYRLNGSTYFAQIDYFLENKGFFGEYTYAYVMKQENSIDIDTMTDFLIAETLLKFRNYV